MIDKVALTQSVAIVLAVIVTGILFWFNPIAVLQTLVALIFTCALCALGVALYYLFKKRREEKLQ